MKILAFSAVLLAVMLLSMGWGAVSIPIGQAAAVLRGGSHAADLDPMIRVILLNLRLPRILLAALVGAGLAVAGTGFQAMFRNPLADPFVIGASSGAALGATTAIVLGIRMEGGRFGPIALAAFVGALASVTIVFLVGEARGQISTISFLLAGVAVSTLLSAGVSLLMVLNDRSLAEAYYWLMGGFSGRSWLHLRAAAPYVVPGMMLMFLIHRLLDALLMGDDTAQGLGINLRLARIMIIATGTIITGAAVAVSGVIGFVGLIAPHVARMLVGARHAVLVPLSALIGALLLLLADSVSRTAFAPMELPVGIITSAIGGPFFLALLLWRPTGFKR